MKINKKVLKISGIVLAGALIFGGGFFGKDIITTHASSSWSADAANQANSDLGKVGYDEKTKLINSATDDINAKVQDGIGQDIQSQEADLQKLLDQYYQDKINGITDTAEYKSLEAQIVQIKENILARYKSEIDTAINSQTSGQ